MANAVEFILSLKNKLSGPANAAKKSLDDVKYSLKSVEATTKLVERATLSSGQKFKDAGGAMIKVNTASRAVARASGLGATQLFRYGAASKNAGVVADVLGRNLGTRTAVGFAKAHAGATAFAGRLPTMNSLVSSLSSGAASLGPMMMGVGTAIAVAGSAAIVGAGSLLKFGGEMANMRTNTMLSLRTLLKGDDKANVAFGEMQAMARAGGLETVTVIQSMQELISKGFGTSEAKNVTFGLADLKVISPGANLEAITRAMSQMKSKGVLSMEELRGQLGDAGLDIGAVMDQIGLKLGKSRMEVDKLISTGKVSSDLGIGAILDSIQAQTGKVLGGAALERSLTTADGALENLKGRFQDLFLAVQSNSGGDAVVRLTKQLADFIDPKGGSGQRVLATLNGIASAVGSVMSSLQGGTLRTILDGLLDGFEAVWPISKAFFGGFMAGFGEAFGAVKAIFQAFTGGKGPALDMVGIAKALGTAFAWVAVGIGTVVAIIGGLVGAVGLVVVGIGTAVVDLVGWMGTTIGEVMDSMTGHWGEIGMNIVRGIAVGMTGSIGEIITAAMSVGSSAVQALKTLLGIASPSKVFAELGGYTAEGFTVGLQSGTPAVSSAASALVAPGALREFGGGGASMSGVTVNVTINVDGNADESESLADRVERALPDALRDAFARMAGEMGAAPAAI